MDSKTFQSDANVDIRLVGTPLFLTPFSAQLSSQRGEMLSSNAQSFVVVEGAEYPFIYSTMENKIGKYQFASDTRDQDVQILDIIPKFRPDMVRKVNQNPKLTVIYLGEDGKIGSFDVNEYTELSHGFGYKNKILNTHLLQKGQYVSKDIRFVSAPNHDEELYMTGLNVNVCYIPYDTGYGTNTNDSFAISSRLQERTKHTVIEKVEFNINPNQTPLNLYGDSARYQVIPYVGEKVREDGYLIALRDTVDFSKDGPSSNKNRSSFLADVTGESLRDPEPLHDQIFKAEPGAEVIDVEIFTNQRMYPSLCQKGSVYEQLMYYQDQYHYYWSCIVDAYEKYKKDGFEFTDAFMNLATYCKGWCYNRGGRSMILMNKKEPVEMITMTITTAYTRTPSRGFKYVGRYGNKGTASSVIPTEKMPRTPDGDYADLLISGDSPFNRLNEGQHYEQAITATSAKVVKAVKEGRRIDNGQPLSTIEDKFEYILEYLGDIRAVNAQLIRETVGPMKEEFVKEILELGNIPMPIPPFTKSIVPELFLLLSSKYGLKHEPLTYWTFDENGKELEKKTVFHHIMGSMYVWLLGKIPQDMLNAVEAGYVSQFNIAIKPKAKSIKFQSSIRQTPNKYGEDETCNLVTTVGPYPTARFYAIYANSPACQELLWDTLLNAEKPSVIADIPMSTKECIETCANISLLKHQQAVTGYEVKHINHKGDEHGYITANDTASSVQH